VALKLIPASSERAGDATSSIIDEGRLLARVRHQNVVTIHGADRIDGCVGLWMEFVRGRTLEGLLQGGQVFEPAEVVRIGLELAKALAAVHAAGLLHRDIKAQNVMRADDGRIVLMDFGTGRDLNDTGSDLTGTPLYLAPELFQGQPATEQSDIYSLGVLLYRLLTRSFPVQGETVRELRLAHERHPTTALRATRPDLPARLARIIDRAIDPRLDKRHATADQLRSDLETAESSPSRPGRRRYASLVLLMGISAWVVPKAGSNDPLANSRPITPTTTAPVAASSAVAVHLDPERSARATREPKPGRDQAMTAASVGSPAGPKQTIADTAVRLGAIEGTVTDCSGIGVPGVHITAFTGSLFASAFEETISGDDGSYQLQALRVGEYLLDVFSRRSVNGGRGVNVVSVVPGETTVVSPITLRDSPGVPCPGTEGQFHSVFIAGFLAGGTPDIDASFETRSLLKELLDMAPVIDAPALPLADVAMSRNLVAPATDAPTIDHEKDLKRYEPLFADTAYWRQIGDQFDNPLIVTGTITFVPSDRSVSVVRNQESHDQSGQRTVAPVRVTQTRRVFTLRANYFFIDGRTGEIVRSVSFMEEVAHKPDERSLVASYFELMRRYMPGLLKSVVEVLHQKERAPRNRAAPEDTPRMPTIVRTELMPAPR
jgi:serine/threonine-protein kinase